MAYTLRNENNGVQGWKYYNGTIKSSYRSAFRTLARTTNYHTKSKAGEFISPTPMTNHTQIGSSTSGVRMTKYGNQTYTAPQTGFGHFGDFISSQAADIAPLKTSTFNDCQDRIYSKLSDSDFNLGVALVEARETFGLIGVTAARLVNSYRSLRRGNVKRALQLLDANNYNLEHKVRRRLKDRSTTDKSISGAWLEAQLAWKPLIADVYGAASLVSKGLQSRDDDIGFSTTKSGHYTSSAHSKFTEYFLSQDKMSLYPKTTGHSSSWKSGRVDTRVQHYYKVVNPYYRNLNALGLLNPQALIWEALPLSFVFDWFVPVGSWLNGMSAEAGLEHVSGFYSQKVLAYEQRANFGAYYTTGYGGSTMSYTGSAQTQTRTFNRSLNIAKPTNPPIRLRGLTEALNGGKLVTSLALLSVFR